MTSHLAATITKSASKQTYYTIRFLVDPPRVADAYRAYAYFRWVDDTLDAGAGAPSCSDDAERLDRIQFLQRQASVLEGCLRGEPPAVACPQERMLVDLVRHTSPADVLLRSYLRQMMRVMDFDVRRRGRLVTSRELDEYTHSLAVAVSDAMHHFIGQGRDESSGDEDRYRAVAGAHILHMLRDTGTDVQAGYFNVPREILVASSIGPADVRSDAYRSWVGDRLHEADADLAAGAAYFARMRSRRHRLAGLGYIARFSWLIDRIRRDDLVLRSTYAGAMDLATRLRMAEWVASSMAARRRSRTGEGAPFPGTGGGP